MIKNIKQQNAELDISGAFLLDDEELKIPVNQIVTFFSEARNRKGEIEGSFSFNGKVYHGILLNVSKFNRDRYLNEGQSAQAVIRKYKDGTYVLTEQHKYFSH